MKGKKCVRVYVCVCVGIHMSEMAIFIFQNFPTRESQHQATSPKFENKQTAKNTCMHNDKNKKNE